MAAFEKGQVWGFKGREVDPNPRVIIIDDENQGDIRIVHVSLLGVKVRNPNVPTGFSDSVGHCPIEENNLKSCVVSLKGLSDIPDEALEGLKTWKSANGGVFTCSLAECLTHIEEAISGGVQIGEPGYYCIEFDPDSTECTIKKSKVSCLGDLGRCQYFTVHVHQ